MPKGSRRSFWSYVNKTDGCWLWTGFCTKDGYGRVTHKRKPVRAHRYSWAQAYGDIPDGLHVLHRCDVRTCVNPAHLFLGTPADNSADKIAKGRQDCPRGDEHSGARMTSADVLRIRELRARGVPVREIAKRVGMPRSTVQHAASGYSWAHLPMPDGDAPQRRPFAAKEPK